MFTILLNKWATRMSASLNYSILVLIISFFISPTQAKAQTFTASGFSQVLVANGINNPTVMAFAPDGRLFVAQQNGALRIIENDVLLGTPAVTLSVNPSGERGLLGIAFDPDFNNNHFIYLYYTLSSAANNRISRFTVSGNTIALSSESVVLNLDPLSGASNHNGGTIQFGPDGKLYVGVGENANSDHSQNLDTYHGKILRINSNGSVPPGNPFTSGSEQRQRVWEYGMRNPYTLSIQPGTGRIFVNDVGEGSREEVNDCTTGGRNYGWPNAEGNSTNPAYTNPIYTYNHGGGIGFGCAITGGTFFNPGSTKYPSQYTGRYFFLDYCNNWIDMLTLSGSTATRSNFASSIAGSPVGMATGPDGNLYFLSRANGAVYKITFTGSSAPVITNQPQSTTISEGNQASFSVTATGTPPLNYQWRKNSVNISGATNSTYTISSVVPADAGNYSVVVSNSAGSVTSNNAALTVTSVNQLPTATINTPATGATYAGGNTFNFSGSGTDPEDGTMASSAFEWYVIFHHDTHVHPGPAAPSGVTSGSFSIPNTGETSANVFYRLYLVVTDSRGGRDTSFRDIIPRTSTITLNTNPQGLQLTLDGQPFTAPLTVTSVEGMLRTIGAPSPQGIYTFIDWSQGGSATQTFATPVANAIYTANYTAPNQLPTATINTPAAGATYAGGNTINFSGSGTDPEDGTMTGTAFEWYVIFHHDADVDPGPAAPSGVMSGSFSIPNTGETSANVFYRLYLVVTDSRGGRDTSFRDIIPRTSTITLNTNPQGLQLTLDGQPFTAPLTVTSVEGMLQTIGAPSPQGIYTFNSWSQGGSATQAFATPVANAIYTANYTAPNQLPTATINTPAAGATYAGGNTINFSGSGTDPEDGTMAASAFEWYVIFHHDADVDPGPEAPSGVTSGSFSIPNTGETSANVFYRLYLVVTDSRGGRDTSFTDIIPRTSTITLNTDPQGLQITLDGQPFTAPLTVASVEGMLRTIGAPSPQGIYTFIDWSQGGSATQTFATPVDDSIYTANYTAPANQLPTATINTPEAGATYAGGDTINFSGSGTDPEDGTMAATAFEWYVVFHYDSLVHPGPAVPSGVTGGSFSIPDTGETSANVFYRLYIVVTDSLGGRDTSFTDIIPRTSTITLNTDPQGLQITLDGQPFTAPFTVTSVEGMLRTIGAPSPQGIYTFNSWSQGGSATQTFATPVDDSIYTANYTAPANQLPTATINTPEAGAAYAGGDTINFSGSGTDPEDGTMAATAFEWYVVFHYDSLVHPGPAVPSGITSGSFSIPDTGETSANVFYRLYLVVIDSLGGRDTSFTDIIPRTSTITLNTDPQGLQITLDGQPFTAPLTVTSVEGMLRTIGAPSPQGIYTFIKWSQGGSATQTFATPVDDSIYTASYDAPEIISTLTPVADAHVRGGKNANTNFGGAARLISQKNSSPGRNYEIFLKFDISTISTTISSAILRLNGRLNNTQTPSIPVEVHNVTDTAWVENDITWNNKPAAEETILATAIVSGTSNKYYEWDITKQVISARDAGLNFVTLKLLNTNSTNNRSRFNSKEAAANIPQLVITYTGSPSPLTRSVEVLENNKEQTGIGPIELLENNKEQMGIVVYPNPVKGNLIIHNYSGPAVLKLYDLGGRLVKQLSIGANTLQQIPVGNLKNGLYLLKIQNEKGVMTKKIVIEN